MIEVTKKVIKKVIIMKVHFHIFFFNYKKYKKIRNNQAVVGWSDFLLYFRM